MALEFLTLSIPDQITAIYVGYFGRAPDPEGLQFWINEYQDGLAEGRSASDVVDSIAESFRVDEDREAANQYPFLQAPDIATEAQITDFLNDVYQNLFNRDVDAEGRAYWTAQIQARLSADGTDGNANTLGDIIVDIISGAQAADEPVINAKIDAGIAYAQASVGNEFTLEDDLPDARAVVQGTNADNLAERIALAQQLAEADGAEGSIGRTFTLTTSIDAPNTDEATSDGINTTGTTGDDTYIANSATLSSADLLAGGGGDDRAELFLDGGPGPLFDFNEALRSTGVETVQVTASNGNFYQVDMTNAQGVTDLANRDTLQGSAVRFENVQAPVDIELTNVDFAGTIVEFDGGSLGTTTALNVEVNDAFAALQIETNGNETINSLNITGDGISGLAIQDGNEDGLDLTTLTIATTGILALGDSNGLALGADTDFQNLATVDASAATGAVLSNLEGSDEALTYTGGAAVDIALFGANFTSADRFSGGQGTDFIGMDFGQVGGITAASVTATEGLILTGTANGNVSLSSDDVDFSTVTIAGDLNGNTLTLDEAEDINLYLVTGGDLGDPNNDDLSDLVSGGGGVQGDSSAIDSFINGTIAFTDTSSATVSLGLPVEANSTIDDLLTESGAAVPSFDVVVDEIDASTVGTLNINTSADGGSSLSVLTMTVDAASNNLVATGAGDLQIQGLNDLAAANEVSLSTIDLSGFTGVFSFGAFGAGLAGSQVFTLGNLDDSPVNFDEFGSDTAANADNFFVDFGGTAANESSSYIDVGAGDNARDVIEFGDTFDYRLAVEGFDAGATAEDDVLDFSALGVSAADLNFADVGGNLSITVDGFGGEVVLIGLTTATFDNASLSF